MKKIKMKNNKSVKNDRRKTGRTKRQIYLIMVFFVVVFVLMTYKFASYAIENKQTLITNSYNGRQKVLAAKIVRGSILARDGDVLVSSEVLDNGIEVRNYTYGNMFSHAVGYAVNGRMGIEADYYYYLLNTNAPLSVKSECDLNKKKYPGDNVLTTFDVGLQRVAYNALGQYKGAIIATDPTTGEILAMVSKPDFDPAEVAEKWEELLADNESGKLVNRVTNGKYPPGSTFKILTALEYIREHNNDYSGYGYNCTGKIKVGEDTIRCYHGTVHGKVDFPKSFSESCNTSFANIGTLIDREKFAETLNSFFFNTKLPTVIAASTDYLEVSDNVTPEDMLQISIGQGSVGISPLHLNMITAAIANDGLLMEPYMVQSVVNCNGDVVEKYDSNEYGRLLSAEEADIMQTIMAKVVREGTGKRLKNCPYFVAGKTGSAEIGLADKESHAWFTGFASMEDENTGKTKNICVTVVIEDAGGSGGEYAAPIAKRLFDEYFGIDSNDY